MPRVHRRSIGSSGSAGLLNSVNLSPAPWVHHATHSLQYHRTPPSSLVARHSQYRFE